MNRFGTLFCASIFGESHGKRLGVVLDGVPAGVALSEADFEADLSRRKSGKRGTTPRKESDLPELVSGVFEGFTTGAPLTILFCNENTLSGDYKNLTTHPRPSHADWVATQKYGGYSDYRGGGHFSGRLTLALVAAGVVAKRILAERASQLQITSTLEQIGGECDTTRFEALIEQAMQAQDSLGGVISCSVSGMPIGLGEPLFDSVESTLAHLLFAVPAVKGVEFGAGFEAAALWGSVHNDPIVEISGRTSTNHAGGVVGGISNGNDLSLRVAIKPTPSISAPQQTLNTASGSVEELVIKGRHDACIAMRAPVVVESVVAMGLCDLLLRAEALKPKTTK